MNRAEELIADLEAEIAKRDARIAKLEMQLGGVVPEGWVPLTIEYEPGYPEEGAFGPQRMMDRLKKWLDRYFAMRLNPPGECEFHGSDIGACDTYSGVAPCSTGECVAVSHEALADFIEYSVPGPYDCDAKWFADKQVLVAALAAKQ